MPEVAIAPNPSPIAAAPNPSGQAPEAGGAEADRAAGAEGSNSFSSVLNRQMNPPQNSEKAAGKTSDNSKAESAASEASSDTESEIAAEEEISTDVIALLAGMLSGVAPPPQVSQALKAQAAGDSGQEGGTDGSQAIAAPLIASDAVHNIASERLDSAAGQGRTLGPATQRNEPAAANIAAPAEAEIADAGKKSVKQENFDALLAAARELPSGTNQANTNHHLQAAKLEAAESAAQVNTPVGAKGWANEVGEKLTWMVGNVSSKAELVLTPPQMGRIEVSLTISGDQASATFVAANPAVREALENAVPRLREILQDAGINLGQTQVGSESSQQWAEHGESGDNRPRGLSDAGGETSVLVGTEALNTQWQRQGNGLVDTFV